MYNIVDREIKNQGMEPMQENTCFSFSNLDFLDISHGTQSTARSNL